MSNDLQNPRMVLVMQGSVKTLIEVRPSGVVSFRGMADQIPENTIELVGTTEPFHIVKIESNLDEKIGYQLETVEEGKSYRLKVTNRLRQGNYNGFIKLLTDVAQKPELLVRVSGFIEGEISVKPLTMLVGKLAAQQPQRTGKVLVSSNRGKPFKITKLSYDERLVEVVQQPLPKEAGNYTLEILPKLDTLEAGSRMQTILTIETDVDQQEKHEVQIHVFNAADTPSAPKDGRAGPAPTPPGTATPGGAQSGVQAPKN